MIVLEYSSSFSVFWATKTGTICDCDSAGTSINEEPVNQGLVNGTGNVVPIPQIIPVPQPQIIPVPIIQNKEDEEEDSKTIIDPMGKGVLIS